MNGKATEIIKNCDAEINNIKRIKETEGSTSEIMRYLTRYCAVKCLSSIEIAFKTIFEELISENSCNTQIANCVHNYIIKKPINPSLENILYSLKILDDNWCERLKKKLKEEKKEQKIKSSLSSLNAVRHKFAHGNDITSSFEEIIEYYNDAVRLLSFVFEIVEADKIKSKNKCSTDLFYERIC